MPGPARNIKLLDLGSKSQNRAKNTKRNISADPVEATTPPPSHMSASGKKHWLGLLPTLEKNKVITVMDMPIFEQMCHLYGYIVELQKKINSSKNADGASGIVAYLDGQNSQTTPLFTALTKAQTEYSKLAGKFGMNPTDRQRVNIEKEKELSEFEKYLQDNLDEDDEELDLSGG